MFLFLKLFNNYFSPDICYTLSTVSYSFFLFFSLKKIKIKQYCVLKCIFICWKVLEILYLSLYFPYLFLYLSIIYHSISFFNLILRLTKLEQNLHLNVNNFIFYAFIYHFKAFYLLLYAF